MDKKKRKLTSSVDVLQSLFEDKRSPLSPQYIRWRLENEWREVVGATIAENCRPANFINGTLYLAVRHPVWTQQLKFMEVELLRKVNEFVGQKWAHSMKYFLESQIDNPPENL